MKLPILLIGYNRPELIHKQLTNFKSLGVNFLNIFVAIDGPKDSLNKKKTIAIKNIIESFSISNRNYIISKKNLGCRDGCIAAISWFFSKVNKGVIIEDDCEFNQSTFSFFYSTNRILESKKFFSVSGSNPFTFTTRDCVKHDDCRNVSEIPLMWGWMTTKEKWNTIDFNARISFRDLIKAFIKCKSLITVLYLLRLSRLTFAKEIDTWDSDIVWHCIRNDLFCIYPSTNQICNVGFGENATNLKYSNDQMKIKIKDIIITPLLKIEKDYTFSKSPSVANKLFKLSFTNKIKLFASESLRFVKNI